MVKVQAAMWDADGGAVVGGAAVELGMVPESLNGRYDTQRIRCCSGHKNLSSCANRASKSRTTQPPTRQELERDDGGDCILTCRIAPPSIGRWGQ